MVGVILGEHLTASGHWPVSLPVTMGTVVMSPNLKIYVFCIFDILYFEDDIHRK